LIVALVLLAVVLAGWALSSAGSLPSILGGSVSSAIVQKFAQAVAYAEGFYSGGSIPSLANNPGDIADNSVTEWAGDTGQRITSANGAQIIVFDSVQDGWNALYQLVETILSGGGSYSSSWTLAQVGAHYANDAGEWASNVAAYLGVPVTTPISQITG
jgi:hypothetical protein